MKKTTPLGSFEEMLLLCLAYGGGTLDGIRMRRSVSQALNKDVAIGALYTTMDRLEEKQLVSSTYEFDASDAEKKERPRKVWTIKSAGRETLKQVEMSREELKKLVVGTDGA